MSTKPKRGAKREEIARHRSPQYLEARERFRSLYDPGEMGDQVRTSVLRAVERNFETPIESRSGRLRMELVGPIEVEATRDPFNYGDIAKTLGEAGTKGTYGSRIKGRIRITEKAADGTETVHDDTEVTLGMLPTPIFDRSYVIDGRKRFLPSAQFRRKPGVFTYKDSRDQFKSEFNLDHFTSSRVPPFSIYMDQTGDSPKMNLSFRGRDTQVPAWHLAKALGASEKDFKKALGSKAAVNLLSSAGGDKEYEKSVRQIYDRVRDSRSPLSSSDVTLAEAEKLIREEFGKSRIDPEVSKLTLGAPISTVGPTAIMSAMARTFQVASGDSAEDNRDSLAFKQAIAPYDMLAEAVGHEKEVRALHDKVKSTLSGMERRMNQPNSTVKPKVKRIIGDTIDKRIKTRLTASQVQRGDSGTNPLDGWSQTTITTLMGEGAISSDQTIPESAKALDGSQLGTIDPTHTPESSFAGINVHLSSGAKVKYKEGSETAHTPGFSEIVTEFLDKKGSKVELAPSDRQGKVVGSFDQYTLDSKGRPRGKEDIVTAFIDGNPTQVRAKEVDYWLPNSGAVLDVSTSLIPFGNSTQGNRAQYAAKQLNQTVPLKYREAPLVQVKTPGGERSLEDLLSADAGAKFSPVDGVVKKITEGQGAYSRSITIAPADGGKDITFHLPKNFPMPGQTSFDSKLVVKEGQKVKSGDLLSDSTFTQDGVLALGTNLRTGYMPWKTDTFEDSIVISEGAARKLTSEHLHRETIESPRTTMGLASYNRAAGAPISKGERDSLDEFGIIKPGTRVEPGQLLMIGSNEVDLRRTEDRTLQRLKLLKGDSGSSIASSPFQKTWGREFAGEVVSVTHKKVGNKVVGADIVIKTDEEMRAGDKIFGRHGNKGVISRVIPDSQMPRVKGVVEITNAGKSKWRVGQEVPEAEFNAAKDLDDTLQSKPATLEILMNPMGVPSRINPSQNLETFLGKVARKNNKAELVDNFGYGSNYDHVAQKLKDADVSDTETIIDPETGKEIRNIGVGVQYITKAKQTVVDKNSARGLGTFNPDTGAVVKGEDGAQLTGELGIYGLLAQNAREVIRDTQLNKTEFRQDVVKALREGRPIPKSVHYPEAFNRFQNYLKAAGVNPTDNDAGQFQLKPLTDSDVRSMTRTATGLNKFEENVIDKPFETLRGKHEDLDKAAIKGGLFDPSTVGGNKASAWSRFELSTKLPNPIYEQSIVDVLGITKSDFKSILEGTKQVEFDKENDNDTEGKRLTGAAAIEGMLKTVDLEAARKDFLAQSTGSNRADKRSQAFRAIRMIDSLKESGVRPEDAFMRKQVAVLPLNMRGIRKDNRGNVVIDDVNYLYRDIGLIDKELKEAREKGLPAKAIAEIEGGLYNSMTSLMQTEGSIPVGGKYQGILGTLSGIRWDSSTGDTASDPRASFFRREVLNRRQAFSARAVLTPDNDLEMDEVGLPRNMAAALLEEDILRLNRARGGVDKEGDEGFTAELDDYIKKGVASTKVEGLLEQAVRDKHMIVKRDPVLHQYGIQGFRPVLLPSDRKAMALNPLVYGGFGADNDGDTLAISLPLSKEANDEVRDKMLPSKNLFNPSSGKLEFMLSHEAVSGVSRLSRRPDAGAKPAGTYKDLKEAESAWEKNKIETDSVISIGGVTTTLGNSLVDSVLPEGFKLADRQSSGDLAEGPFALTKGPISSVLSDVALKSPETFPTVANELRKLGQKYSSYSGLSVTMEDLKPVLVEDRKIAGRNLSKKMYDISRSKKLTEVEKERAVKETYSGVMNRLSSDARKGWMESLKAARPNSLVEMVSSGARGNYGQLEQMLMAPVAVLDSQDKVIRTPIMRNYTEGLSASDYWAAANGARKGAINKVVQVQDPGSLSKQLINTTMDLVVSETDCGSTSGTTLDLSDPANATDAAGRTLTTPLRVGSISFNAGYTLTTGDVGKIRREGKGAIRAGVRSPMTCKAQSGICQKCAGYAVDGSAREIGFNQGVVAAQSLGERSTQLMLSSFHSGGRFDPKGGTAGDLFGDAQALLRMPKNMTGNASILAKEDGRVTSVKEDKAKAGYVLKSKTDTGTSEYFIPKSFTAPDGKTKVPDFFKPGTKLTKGGLLTGGLANPANMLAVTGDIGKTREYMADSLHGLFKDHGIQRRHVETVVHSMTSTVEVKDPGTSSLLPGHRLPSAVAERMKGEHPTLVVVPVMKGVNVAPRELREDYMAQLNSTNIRKSLTQSIARSAKSDIHGLHPIPGMGAATEFNRPGRDSPGGSY